MTTPPDTGRAPPRWPAPLLTLSAIFWAGNAIAARVAIGQVSPFMLVSLRWVIVMAVLWPIYGREVRQHWGAARPRMLAIALMASLGFTGFNALYYIGALSTTAVNLGILQGSMPIFVLAGAFVAYRTPVTPLQLVGALVTLAGVLAVATRGEPLKLLEVELNRGDLYMLAACALYAYYAVALRNRPPMPGLVFFTLLAGVAAVSSLPLVAIEAMTTGITWPTPLGWLVTAFVAIFPSCLAQVFFLKAVDAIGPGRAGVFINLVPVFGAILAVWLLGEPFAAYHAAALLLVLGGIALAQRS